MQVGCYLILIGLQAGCYLILIRLQADCYLILIRLQVGCYLFLIRLQVGCYLFHVRLQINLFHYSGVWYLHDNVIHGNIKPQNILHSADKKEMKLFPDSRP